MTGFNQIETYVYWVFLKQEMSDLEMISDQ